MHDKLKILIINEQDNYDQEILNFLEKEEYETFTFDNEIPEINRIKELNPALIISGINITDESTGIILCEKIKNNCFLKNIPFLFLSKNSESINIIRSLEAGANGYILKPFKKETLISKIHFLIAESELRKNNTSEFGLEISLGGKKHFITQEKTQIIELVLESFLKSSKNNPNLKEANNALLLMQHQLEKKNQELNNLNEQKNELLRIAAHDLREPLGIIWRISNSLIKEGFKDFNPQQQNFISLINSYSRFMLNLLSDILIFFNQIHLNLSPVDLVSIIGNAIDINKQLAIENYNKLVFDKIDNLPLLCIDSGKIEIVLNNLLSNAIKYSFSGSEIEIKIKNSEKEIIISIKNVGSNIPDEDQEKLFKPFQKYSSKPGGIKKGDGLGLSIVKKIISAHNGKIWVENNIPKQTTFYFSLPLNS
jgi:two-component system sensor histidine kinase/response regulator